jgi:glycosyltransferase involved in cell wall biosynthesis
MARGRVTELRRVLYSGLRFSHHSAGSGYDGVVPDRRHFVCSSQLPLARFPEASFLRHLNFLLVDLLTLVRGLRYDAVHYIYPENTAYLSAWLLRLLGKRIVYTVHLSEQAWLAPTRSPFMRLKQFSLRAAHAIAVLSRAQRQAYRQRFPDKLVRFVPHGLSFEMLTAAIAPLPRRRGRLLVVGQNYRNFELLERIVSQRGERNVVFELVGMDERIRARFARYPEVSVHPRLDRTAYETLLQQALALVLPLSFSTANNALLEAYKFGLPVLASRIPGITDYALSVERDLFGTASEFWNAYDALAALDDRTLQRLGARARRVARQRFGWPNIRAQLEELYRPQPSAALAEATHAGESKHAVS